MTFWISVMGIFTTSSIGYGNDQCNPGLSRRFLPLADRFAKAQNDRLFLRADREKTRSRKTSTTSSHHDEFDDGEAAAQRLGQRLRTGVPRFRRGPDGRVRDRDVRVRRSWSMAGRIGRQMP